MSPSQLAGTSSRAILLVLALISLLQWTTHVEAKSYQPDTTGAIHKWHVQFNNSLPGGERTIYMCQVFKFTKLVDRKHQIVGFTPIIEKKNEQRVHHIIINKCKDTPEIRKIADAPGAVNCFSPDVNANLLTDITELAFLWTIGSKGVMFPDNTGIALEDKDTYFTWQMHYDNPSEEAFTDESGGEFHFISDSPREYDSGFFAVAHRISPFHFIPPKSESFKVSAFCSRECTKQILPEDGITVTHVLLHAHFSITKFILRHVRNGVELQPIGDIQKFDPYVQEYITPDTPVKILPGDELIVECTSNTTGRDEVTFGGFGALNEMCYAFMHYYPKTPELTNCVSQPEFRSFFNAVGVQKVESYVLDALGYPFKTNQVPAEKMEVDGVFLVLNKTGKIDFSGILPLIKLTEPEELTGKTFDAFVKGYDWAKLNKEFQEKIYDGKHYTFCGNGTLETFVTDQPKIIGENVA